MGEIAPTVALPPDGDDVISPELAALDVKRGLKALERADRTGHYDQRLQPAIKALKSLNTETDPETGELLPETGRLPESFWDSRPSLRLIANAADHKVVSREGLLLTCLARASNKIPPHRYFGGPRKGAPHLIVLIVGNPEAGKGTILEAAEILIPTDGERVTTSGSAEGLADRFFEKNPSDDEEDVKRHPQVLTDKPVYIRVDEIDTYNHTAKNSAMGLGLIGQWKQAFSGEQLGFGNKNTPQLVPAHQYRLNIVMGVAPAKADTLLDDVGGGLPQRMLVAPASAEHIPDDTDPISPWPDDELTIAFGPDDQADLEIPIPPSVQEEVRRENLRMKRRAKNDELSDPMDAHQVLVRVKVAVALAALAGRLGVIEDDWEIAAHVVAMSRHHRDELRIAIARERALKFGAKRGQQIETQVLTEAALQEVKDQRHHEFIVKAAMAITKKLRAGSQTRGWISQKSSTVRRAYLDEILECAVTSGWLTMEIISTGGTDGERYTITKDGQHVG